MCSEPTSTSELPLPWLLYSSLVALGCTVLATNLRLMTMSPRSEKLRTPLLKHHVEMQRTNVFELRPQRPIAVRQTGWLTR